METNECEGCALAVALILGGCSTDVGLRTGRMQARWNAQNVYPQHYKNDLMAFLRTYLNDPDARARRRRVAPQLKTVGPGERYVACVRYNARDSDGKYTGVKHGAADLRVRQARPLRRQPKDGDGSLQGRGLMRRSRSSRRLTR